jgi:phage repressor protein C with HTH and peptisase S24 domain
MYYIRDMKNLAERLAFARERMGLTQGVLAKMAGVSQGTIGNLEAGLRNSTRSILEIAAALGVDATWLSTGKGEMGGPADPAAPSSPFIEDGAGVEGRPVRGGEGPDSVAIPRVKLRLRAGVSNYETEPDMGDDGHELIPAALINELQLKPVNLLAVRVRGESMEPMLFEDDVVIIDKSDIRPISREVYAVNIDGEACVKQLIHRGGQWYLHSLHSDHGPVNVRSAQVSIVGRVVIQPTRVLTGRL